ncbi:MAG: hypothetical protein ABIX44_01295 [Cryobacterium sp.]
MPPTTSATAQQGTRLIDGSGTGDFEYEGPGALSGHPIRVWYSAPPTDSATAEILIVMTGTQRDGERYRADWLPLLQDRNTLLLVPEFSEDEYPGVWSYNLGKMLDRHGDPQPRDDWAFNMVEALFDAVVADVGSTATGYAFFGHSAGAQFVHRFIEFMPKNRVRIAVAANAGWYTVMDDSIPFPYGLEEAPRGVKDMKAAFSSKLTILLGADDIDPKDDSLQRDNKTDKQGKNRLARGLNFYEQAREAAGTETFNWQLIVVPGIAHSNFDMARAAAPLVLTPTDGSK